MADLSDDDIRAAVRGIGMNFTAPDIKVARAAIAADRALNAAPSVGAEGLPGFAAWWRDNFEAGTPQDASFAEAERCARVVWMAALASRPAVDAWQPIETAPKNGKDCLVFTETGLVRLAFFDTARGGVWSSWPGRNEYAPTHWMPLPAAPDAARHPAQREGE